MNVWGAELAAVLAVDALPIKLKVGAPDTCWVEVVLGAADGKSGLKDVLADVVCWVDGALGVGAVKRLLLGAVEAGFEKIPDAEVTLDVDVLVGPKPNGDAVVCELASPLGLFI